MAQRLLKHTLPYSKNFLIIKNQTLLLKSGPVIYKPFAIRSIQSQVTTVVTTVVTPVPPDLTVFVIFHKENVEFIICKYHKL
jgi:hypothetical protein